APAYPNHVQVVVVRAHHRLEDQVEVGESELARHPEATPDGRVRAFQRDLEFVDGLRLRRLTLAGGPAHDRDHGRRPHPQNSRDRLRGGTSGVAGPDLLLQISWPGHLQHSKWPPDLVPPPCADPTSGSLPADVVASAPAEGSSEAQHEAQAGVDLTHEAGAERAQALD